MIAHAAALAAEGAEHAAEHPPFWEGAEFWVFIGFLLFIALVGRIAYRVVTVSLDDRAHRIKSQMEEAQRLQAEAQELLASYERKQREAAEEAEAIVEDARREADRLAVQAAADLETAIKRREQLALERIAQAENAALAEVRAQAVDLAIRATERLLASDMDEKRANALIDKAIEELPARLKTH